MIDKIINAATICFSRNGFHKTSIDDIARELNASKGSIYYYFNNKSDIIYKVIESGILKINSYLEKEVTIDQPISLMLQNVVDHFVATSFSCPEVIRVTYNGATEGLDDELVIRINALHDSTIQIVAKHLSYGAKINAIKKDIDYEMAAVGVVAMLSNMCLSNMNRDMPLNKEVIIRLIVTLITTGIYTEDKESIPPRISL